MDLSASMYLHSPLKHTNDRDHDHDHDQTHESSMADSDIFHKKSQLPFPSQFIWPKLDVSHPAADVLKEPIIDLEGFCHNDEVATEHAANAIKAACLSHGFFQVINHGVDLQLIKRAYQHIDAFFKLPISKKMRAKKENGSLWGFSSAHGDRFASKLPWKETLSFGFNKNGSDKVVEHFFNSAMGKEFEQTGLIYQKYCESMKALSLSIMELLGISLGVDEYTYYKEFFKDSSSMMRCNYYPPCQEPDLAMGTGPHCDPNALTILHQDQVGGLEVLVNNKWKSVQPRQDAFVINLGDTFTALTNGRYKSCLHRAVVNSYNERISLAFFVCPSGDKVVRPPQDLIGREGTRKYPDFTWSDLLHFTQKHYRADDTTLQNFTHWFLSSKPTNYSTCFL